jgi:hypothetical protein
MQNNIDVFEQMINCEVRVCIEQQLAGSNATDRIKVRILDASSSSHIAMLTMRDDVPPIHIPRCFLVQERHFDWKRDFYLKTSSFSRTRI